MQMNIIKRSISEKRYSEEENKYLSIISKVILTHHIFDDIKGEKRFVAELKIHRKGLCFPVSMNIYAPTQNETVKIIKKIHLIAGYRYEILSLIHKGNRREWNDNEFLLTKSGGVLYMKDKLTGMEAQFEISKKHLNFITERVHSNVANVDLSRSLTLMAEYVEGKYMTNRHFRANDDYQRRPLSESNHPKGMCFKQ